MSKFLSSNLSKPSKRSEPSLRLWLVVLIRILLWLWPGRRRILRENIRCAYPRASKRWVERLSRAAEHRISAGFASAFVGREVLFQGWEHIQDACRQGRGVLVLTLHLGPHEGAIRSASQKLGGLGVIGRPLPFCLQRRIIRDRRKAGVDTFPPSGGLAAAAAALTAGRVVVVVLDQHTPPGNGIFVPFMGTPASTSQGLAWLEERTEAPVVPVEPFFGAGGQYIVRIYPPLPSSPKEGTRLARRFRRTAQYTKVIEAMVRRHPSQWLWTHRRWKTSALAPQQENL